MNYPGDRIRFNPAEASEAGSQDGQALMAALAAPDTQPAPLLADAMAEIIGLAVENRIDECQARLEAFCAVVGPELLKVKQVDSLQSMVDKLANADKAMAEALAMNVTDSEGGEL